MIKVVMLGSGASIPSPSRSVSCTGIKYEGNVYLFDACEGVQRQLMTYKLSYSKVKVIFISHLHADHYLGLPGLIYTLTMNDFSGKLKIMGPRGIEEIVNSLLINKLPSFIEITEFDDENEIVYEDKDFTIKAFKVEHISDSYGFVFEENEKRNFNEKKCKKLGIEGVMFSELNKKGKIKIGKKEILIDDVSELSKGKKITFSGDTIYCDNVLKYGKSSDLLIHDATFIEQHSEDAKEKMHATAKEAAKMATFTNSKQLILTHISNRYKTGEEHLKEAKEIFENTLVAEDGLEIEL